MSIKNVEKFLNLVKSNENLQKELILINEKLQKEEGNEEKIIADNVVPLAKKNGIIFTANDFLQYANEQMSALSEEDLLNVSGGISTRNTAAALLVAFLGSLGVGAAVNLLNLPQEDNKSLVRKAEKNNGEDSRNNQDEVNSATQNAADKMSMTDQKTDVSEENNNENEAQSGGNIAQSNNESSKTNEAEQKNRRDVIQNKNVVLPNSNAKNTPAAPQINVTPQANAANTSVKNTATTTNIGSVGPAEHAEKVGGYEEVVAGSGKNTDKPAVSQEKKLTFAPEVKKETTAKKAEGVKPVAPATDEDTSKKSVTPTEESKEKVADLDAKSAEFFNTGAVGAAEHAKHVGGRIINYAPFSKRFTKATTQAKHVIGVLKELPKTNGLPDWSYVSEETIDALISDVGHIANQTYQDAHNRYYIAGDIFWDRESVPQKDLEMLLNIYNNMISKKPSLLLPILRKLPKTKDKLPDLNEVDKRFINGVKDGIQYLSSLEYFDENGDFDPTNQIAQNDVEMLRDLNDKYGYGFGYRDLFYEYPLELSDINSEDTKTEQENRESSATTVASGAAKSGTHPEGTGNLEKVSFADNVGGGKENNLEAFKEMLRQKGFKSGNQKYERFDFENGSDTLDLIEHILNNLDNFENLDAESQRGLMLDMIALFEIREDKDDEIYKIGLLFDDLNDEDFIKERIRLIGIEINQLDEKAENMNDTYLEMSEQEQEGKKGKKLYEKYKQKLEEKVKKEKEKAYWQETLEKIEKIKAADYLEEENNHSKLWKFYSEKVEPNYEDIVKPINDFEELVALNKVEFEKLEDFLDKLAPYINKFDSLDPESKAVLLGYIDNFFYRYSDFIYNKETKADEIKLRADYSGKTKAIVEKMLEIGKNNIFNQGEEKEFGNYKFSKMDYVKAAGATIVFAGAAIGAAYIYAQLPTWIDYFFPAQPKKVVHDPSQEITTADKLFAVIDKYAGVPLRGAKNKVTSFATKAVNKVTSTATEVAKKVNSSYENWRYGSPYAEKWQDDWNSDNYVKRVETNGDEIVKQEFVDPEATVSPYAEKWQEDWSSDNYVKRAKTNGDEVVKQEFVNADNKDLSSYGKVLKSSWKDVSTAAKNVIDEGQASLKDWWNGESETSTIGENSGNSTIGTNGGGDYIPYTSQDHKAQKGENGGSWFEGFFGGSNSKSNARQTVNPAGNTNQADAIESEGVNITPAITPAPNPAPVPPAFGENNANISTKTSTNSGFLNTIKNIFKRGGASKSTPQVDYTVKGAKKLNDVDTKMLQNPHIDLGGNNTEAITQPGTEVAVFNAGSSKAAASNSTAVALPNADSYRARGDRKGSSLKIDSSYYSSAEAEVPQKAAPKGQSNYSIKNNPYGEIIPGDEAITKDSNISRLNIEKPFEGKFYEAPSDNAPGPGKGAILLNASENTGIMQPITFNPNAGSGNDGALQINQINDIEFTDIKTFKPVEGTDNFNLKIYPILNANGNNGPNNKANNDITTPTGVKPNIRPEVTPVAKPPVNVDGIDIKIEPTKNKEKEPKSVGLVDPNGKPAAARPIKELQPTSTPDVNRRLTNDEIGVTFLRDNGVIAEKTEGKNWASTSETPAGAPKSAANKSYGPITQEEFNKLNAETITQPGKATSTEVAVFNAGSPKAAVPQSREVAVFNAGSSNKEVPTSTEVALPNSGSGVREEITDLSLKIDQNYYNSAETEAPQSVELVDPNGKPAVARPIKKIQTTSTPDVNRRLTNDEIGVTFLRDNGVIAEKTEGENWASTSKTPKEDDNAAKIFNEYTSTGSTPVDAPHSPEDIKTPSDLPPMTPEEVKKSLPKPVSNSEEFGTTSISDLPPTQEEVQKILDQIVPTTEEINTNRGKGLDIDRGSTISSDPVDDEFLKIDRTNPPGKGGIAISNRQNQLGMQIINFNHSADDEKNGAMLVSDRNSNKNPPNPQPGPTPFPTIDHSASNTTLKDEAKKYFSDHPFGTAAGATLVTGIVGAAVYGATKSAKSAMQPGDGNNNQNGGQDDDNNNQNENSLFDFGESVDSKNLNAEQIGEFAEHLRKNFKLNNFFNEANQKDKEKLENFKNNSKFNKDGVTWNGYAVEEDDALTLIDYTKKVYYSFYEEGNSIKCAIFTENVQEFLDACEQDKGDDNDNIETLKAFAAELQGKKDSGEVAKLPDFLADRVVILLDAANKFIEDKEREVAAAPADEDGGGAAAPAPVAKFDAEKKEKPYPEPVSAPIAVQPAAAVSEGNLGDNLNWKFNAESETLTISGNGEMLDFEAAPWGHLNDRIKNVVIGDGVTSINSKDFFKENNSVVSLVVKGNITKVEQGFFENCANLAKVTFEGNVETFGNSAFYGCQKLTEFNYRGNTVPKFENYVLLTCNQLKEVTVTENYEGQNGDAFSRWDIKVKKPAPPAPADEGGKKPVAPLDGGGEEAAVPAQPAAAVTEGNLGDNLNWKFNADTKTLTISGNVPMPNFEIEGNAKNWPSKDIEKVVIEEGVESIGAWSFYGFSNLTSVQIPKSVTSIGMGAFYGCSKIADITIPKKVNNIDERAFSDCRSLTQFIILGKKLDYIGSKLFWGCDNLHEITATEAYEGDMEICSKKVVVKPDPAPAQPPVAAVPAQPAAPAPEPVPDADKKEELAPVPGAEGEEEPAPQPVAKKKKRRKTRNERMNKDKASAEPEEKLDKDLDDDAYAYVATKPAPAKPAPPPKQSAPSIKLNVVRGLVMNLCKRSIKTKIDPIKDKELYDGMEQFVETVKNPLKEKKENPNFIVEETYINEFFEQDSNVLKKAIKEHKRKTPSQLLQDFAYANFKDRIINES